MLEVFTIDDLSIALEETIAPPGHTLEHRHSSGNSDQEEHCHCRPWPALHLLEYILASAKLKPNSQQDTQHRQPAAKSQLSHSVHGRGPYRPVLIFPYADLALANLPEQCMRIRHKSTQNLVQEPSLPEATTAEAKDFA